MTDQWQTLGQLVTDLGRLLGALLQFALHWALLIAWLAWWLWGVNWKKVWAVLAEGAWAPVLLLIVLAALVWSALVPGDCNCLGFVSVPGFWWQLGAVGLLTALTLLCGWLQGVFGWTPQEVSVEPPAHPAQGPGHDHGHGHGHH